MDAALEELVRRRARFRCEYCLLPESLASTPFQFDHIIAQSHGGQTTDRNLALACFHCNNFKGPNLAGIDPDTGRVTRLFHPRRDSRANVREIVAKDKTGLELESTPVTGKPCDAI